MWEIGKRYLLITQRYIFSGTVVSYTPTHLKLGDDAQIHYDDVGDLGPWSKGPLPFKIGSAVPGQIISLLGTDGTPIP